jgi:hypothetical protein
MKNTTPELERYVKRFNEQFTELAIDFENEETFVQCIREQSTAFNNMLMAGFGACTLMLRLGAVYNMCLQLEKGTEEQDAIFLKQIIDNLSETLPSDTNWFNVWNTSVGDRESKWFGPLNKPKGEQHTIFQKFITFRNHYVHGKIGLNENHSNELKKGLSVIHTLCNEVVTLFDGLKLVGTDSGYCIEQDGMSVPVHPFIQKGADADSVYLFQGIQKRNELAELIGVKYGDIQHQSDADHMAPVFDPMKDQLKGGAGQRFDHTSRIDYYAGCFVGREKEVDEIIEWSMAQTDQNILRIFSQAGMGKGALVANIVQQLQDRKQPVLYHFCGSGVHNSLHASLYHKILQGHEKLQIWDNSDPEIKRKLDRLPGRYHDAIHLFQELLDNCFKVQSKNPSGNLVVVIDGLDEAAVAYSMLHISDWFSKYNDQGEVEEKWMSKSNIRWIFTYREGFYRFPNFENSVELASVQPLQGLTPKAAQVALARFSPSDEFVEEVIKRGAVV